MLSSITVAADARFVARTSVRWNRWVTCWRESRDGSGRICSGSASIIPDVPWSSSVRSCVSISADCRRKWRWNCSSRSSSTSWKPEGRQPPLRVPNGWSKKNAPRSGMSSMKWSENIRYCWIEPRRSIGWAFKRSILYWWRARQSDCTRSSARHSTQTSMGIRWRCTSPCPLKRKLKHESSWCPSTTFSPRPTASRLRCRRKIWCWAVIGWRKNG